MDQNRWSPLLWVIVFGFAVYALTAWTHKVERDRSSPATDIIRASAP